MTDPHDLPLLKDSQESALQFRGYISDLIEEDRPVMGKLEETCLTPLDGSGESTVDIPEQLTLEQVFREGGTVDGNELLGVACRGVVDTLCEQFLTRSRLTVDEDV